MLKKGISAALAVLMALEGGGIFIPSATAQTAKKEYTIAVLRLDTKQVSEVEGETLTNRLMSTTFQLINSDAYRSSGKAAYIMVERADMDKILDQFNVQNSGCVSDSCAIALGKMLAADRIAFGSVSYAGNSYSLSLRIVDVETSKAVAIADIRQDGTFERLLDRGVPEIVNRLFVGEQKKSRTKWYILAGVVAAGAGAAILSGGGGGGTEEEPLPTPPDMPK